MAFQGFQQDAFQPLNTPGQGGDPAPLPHLGLVLGTASGNIVNPTTGHLTFAGYAPGITQNRSYAATTGHLTFAGYVAGIDQDRSYTATTGHLTFAGYVAGVAQGGGLNPASLPHLGMGASPAAAPNVVSPTKGALSFTGYVPTVTQVAATGPAYLPHITLGASPAPEIYSPATGHMSFVGYVPGVLPIQTTTGHLTFTGRTPTQGNQAIIVEWDDVGADAGYRVKWGTATNTYTFSADVATDVLTYTIQSLTYGQTYYIRIYALVGGVEQDPSAEIRLTAGWCFLPTKGNLAFSGKVPGISQGSGIGATPTTGHLTFAGYAPGIDQDRSYTPTTGHLTFAGYIPSVAQARTVDTTTGHLTFAGYVPRIDQTGPRVAFPTEGHLFFRGYAPTVSGYYVAVAVGGGGGKPRRRRHYVEIDGQYFEVRDHQHAVEILTKLHEAAKEAAPEVVAQVAETVETPPDPPQMRVVKPDYSQEFIQQLQAQVDATNAQIAKVYAEAWKAHVAQQQAIAQQILAQRQADEDDIETLISMGIL